MVTLAAYGTNWALRIRVFLRCPVEHTTRGRSILCVLLTTAIALCLRLPLRYELPRATDDSRPLIRRSTAGLAIWSTTPAQRRRVRTTRSAKSLSVGTPRFVRWNGYVVKLTNTLGSSASIANVRLFDTYQRSSLFSRSSIDLHARLRSGIR